MSIKEGWKCPQCGRIHAPYVPECFVCNVQLKIVVEHKYPDKCLVCGEQTGHGGLPCPKLTAYSL